MKTHLRTLGMPWQMSHQECLQDSRQGQERRPPGKATGERKEEACELKGERGAPGRAEVRGAEREHVGLSGEVCGRKGGTGTSKMFFATPCGKPRCVCG